MKVPQGAKVTKVVCYVGEEVSGTAFGAVEEDDQGNDDPTETESGGAQPTETTETGGAVAMGLGLGFIGVIGVLTVGLVEIF